MPPRISVILCTRNPHKGRLEKTLRSLNAQTLPQTSREILLIDNGSQPALTVDELRACAPSGLRIVCELETGLTPARLRGISEANGEVLVFVDDDNVLNPAYLESALTFFTANPRLGAAGGPVRADFEITPPAWTAEFHGLLAIQEHGPDSLIATGGKKATWPAFAPVGAGLCVRRTAALAYATAVKANPLRKLLDRKAGALSSGGDNDLVFTLLQDGWDVAYYPALALTHLIPAARLNPDYLCRLNRGIQRSWVRVLALHSACPWPVVPPFTLPIRAARAWFRSQAWQGKAERIRFYGLLGRLEGQSDLYETPRPPA